MHVRCPSVHPPLFRPVHRHSLAAELFRDKQLHQQWDADNLQLCHGQRERFCERQPHGHAGEWFCGR